MSVAGSYVDCCICELKCDKDFNCFTQEYYYFKKSQFLELLILKSGTSLEKDLIKWEKENPEPKV